MRRQRVQRVRNVEVGVRLVLSHKRVAVLGGRETLYYDTERFGSHNFHLSEKLYTRYSAIALQIGCPYLETFNNVVMTLFEAGIVAKMTTDEYKNLPEHARRSDPVTESDKQGGEVMGESAATSSQTPQGESTKGLQPVSLRMLRGAFCLLGIGHLLAAISLAVEIQLHRRSKRRRKPEHNEHRKAQKLLVLGKSVMLFKRGCKKVCTSVFTSIDKALGSDNKDYFDKMAPDLGNLFLIVVCLLTSRVFLVHTGVLCRIFSSLQPVLYLIEQNSYFAVSIKIFTRVSENARLPVCTRGAREGNSNFVFKCFFYLSRLKVVATVIVK
uniref:Putative chemosensory ionotropic receptor IR40a n=1 Tax=Spodoptera littoralis TaxID=7109 RepID=E5FIA5_SPOLI|nr:putative chemosensory ionotropic receptor IR40a [Spodoptera littoralis]